MYSCFIFQLIKFKIAHEGNRKHYMIELSFKSTAKNVCRIR